MGKKKRKPPRPHRVNPSDPRYSTRIRATGYPRGAGDMTPQEAYTYGQLVENDYISTKDALKHATLIKRVDEILRDALGRDDFTEYMKADLKRDAEKRKHVLSNLKLKPMRTEEYDELHVAVLTPEQQEQMKTPYKYLIKDGALSHSAFRTKKGFNRWMRERGLSLGYQYRAGQGESYQINGSYKRTSFKGNQCQLDKLAKEEGYPKIAVLSNGEYVRGYVRNGNEVLYMNPNYPRRKLKYRRP